MTSLAPSHRGASLRGLALPPSWPLYFVFLSFPVWWAMGAAYFIWPILTFPLLLSLLVRRNIKFPPKFGLWLLFLAWMFLSAVQLDTNLSFALFAYRSMLYISATILFLYVFNASRDHLSDRTVFGVLTLFWAAVIVGGFLGVFFPYVSFSTPVESLVPQSFLQDKTAYYFVHPGFSEVMTFLGYPVGRPKTFFAYTNQWGACVAVLTPIALAAFSRMAPGIPRRLVGALLILSFVPIIFSLNRGLWLALGAGLAYLAVRFARIGKIRTLVAGAAGVAVLAAVVVATPLGTLTEDRFTSERNSNNTRMSVYEQTVEQVRGSPFIGYGSPRSQVDENVPAIGTQGQLFTLTYSYGIPALLFFAGWLLYTFWRTRRRRSYTCFWVSAAIFILLVELPYYNFMPTTLHVIMVALAVAWRDVVDPAPEPPDETGPRNLARSSIAAA